MGAIPSICLSSIMAATPFAAELIATANAIAAAGKGILAADESGGTIGKRFETIGARRAGHI
jgi:hypothetical protein